MSPPKKRSEKGRKPPGNAARNRRRSGYKTLPRPLPPPTPVVEPVDEPVEDPTWAVDPDATWWDDVWPFKDEAEPESEPESEPEPEPELEPEPAPVQAAEEPVEEEPEEEPAEAAAVAGLAAAPGHPSAVAAPRRSRRAVRWTALVLAAAVVAAGIVWFVAGRQSHDQARLTRSDTFATPVRLAPDTSRVRSRVLPSGDLLVTHWIRSSRPVHTVTLRTPQVPGLAPGALHVGDVVLATDGLVSSVPGQPRGSDLVTYRIPPTHLVYVRYRISGAVERAGPQGRALARITSVDVETGSALAETTQTVVGARVLALACSSDSTTAVAVPCGSDDRGRWSVRLGRAESASRVMAQLDLS